MTVKERVIEQLDEFNEAELLEVEEDLRSRANQARIKRQLEALRAVAGSITNPEDVAAFEAATKRQFSFVGYTLGINEKA